MKLKDVRTGKQLLYQMILTHDQRVYKRDDDWHAVHKGKELENFPLEE